VTNRVLLEWQPVPLRPAEHVALAWEADAYAYRLVIRGGVASIQRSRWTDRGPWRPMPYPQHLVEQLARLCRGEQWREAATP
jgi:hypothetical protein